MGFDRLGFDPAGFDPVGVGVPATRPWFAEQLRDHALLDGWEIYAEPPEQLASGPCIVVAPRSPYQSHATYGTIETHLVAHVLVPRAHGPAMDLIDYGLAALRAVLEPIAEAGIGPVSSVGVLSDVGAVDYIAASLDVDLS